MRWFWQKPTEIEENADEIDVEAAFSSVFEKLDTILLIVNRLDQRHYKSKAVASPGVDNGLESLLNEITKGGLS